MYQTVPGGPVYVQQGVAYVPAPVPQAVYVQPAQTYVTVVETVPDYGNSDRLAASLATLKLCACLGILFFFRERQQPHHFSVLSSS